MTHRALLHPVVASALAFALYPLVQTGCSSSSSSVTVPDASSGDAAPDAGTSSFSVEVRQGEFTVVAVRDPQSPLAGLRIIFTGDELSVSSVTVSVRAAAELPTPSGAVYLGPTVEVLPHGLSLLKPVTVYFPISSKLFPDAQAVVGAPQSLLVYRQSGPDARPGALGLPTRLLRPEAGAVVLSVPPGRTEGPVRLAPNAANQDYDQALVFRTSSFSTIAPVVSPFAVLAVVTECSADAQCNLREPCSKDACEPGRACDPDGSNCRDVNVCTHTWSKILDPCDDGDPSTVQDSCYANGDCRGVPRECFGAPDCDDLNTCTEDSCLEGLCKHKKLSGTSCDDKDPNTEFSQCSAGKCESFRRECVTPADCTDGRSCTEDLCDNGWLCLHDYGVSNGKPCTDPSQVGVIGECAGGECMFNADRTCWIESDCATANECLESRCVGADGAQGKRGACSHTKTSGKACRRGNQDDGTPLYGVCADGSCVRGSPSDGGTDAGPDAAVADGAVGDATDASGEAAPEASTDAAADASVCVDGAYRCLGDVSQSCYRGEWSKRNDCAALGTTCVASTGTCDWITCPEGVRECSNGQLEECRRVNGALTWEVVTNCLGGGQECVRDACVPKAVASGSCGRSSPWTCFNDAIWECRQVSSDPESYAWSVYMDCRHFWIGVGTCKDATCALSPHPDTCEQFGQHYCSFTFGDRVTPTAHRCAGGVVEWQPCSPSSEACHLGQCITR